MSSGYGRRHEWYQRDADAIIERLQQKVWPLNFHIALGGGVLNHGYSDKDLDLYVLPIYIKDKKPDYLKLIEAIESELGPGEAINHYLRGKAFFSEDMHFVDGKRVDVFVVRA